MKNIRYIQYIPGTPVPEWLWEYSHLIGNPFGTPQVNGVDVNITDCIVEDGEGGLIVMTEEEFYELVQIRRKNEDIR